MSRSSAEGHAGFRLCSGFRPGLSSPPGVRDSAQVEPLAALAAVFALTVGLGLYVHALGGTVSTGPRPLAPTALDAVASAASDPTGVIDPARLDVARGAAPADHDLNATVTTGDGYWAVGPPIPPGVPDRARRRVAVASRRNRTVTGRLRVVVW